MQMLSDNYGNPSSMHTVGTQAQMALRAMREQIATSVGADEREIVFTSGGTEANNLAVFGAAYANRRRGNRIVTTAIEHESVLESVRQLEAEGFEVIRLQPDIFGRISEAQLSEAINSDTILVSMMYINNEVGSILPVGAIRGIVKRANAPALIHVDAVQAYGKVAIKVKLLDVDLLSVSGHKVHGPKGVGALYIKKGTHLRARSFGGEQEAKLRPGTEAVPLIAGFSAAVAELPNCKVAEQAVKELNAAARAGLQAMKGVLLNSEEDASAYVINFSVQGIRSQPMIGALSEKKIYVSSGSACTKGRRSHVLTAMGLAADVIDSAVRISFAHDSTRGDVSLFLTAVAEVKKDLLR